MKRAVAKEEKRKIFKTKVLPAILLACLTFAAVKIAQFVVIKIAVTILSPEMAKTTLASAICAVTYYALAILLIVFVPVIFVKKWKFTREEIGLKELPTWTDIGLSPIFFIVYFFVSSFIVSIFAKLPGFDVTTRQDTGFGNSLIGTDRVIAFIILVVVAPIIEEVIFRGILYGKLRAKYSLPLSLIVTSLVFALLHSPASVCIDVFVLSVALCFLREITGTVYAGILVHMIKNALAFYSLYILFG